MLLTSAVLRPSAEIRSWLMSTFRVDDVGQLAQADLLQRRVGLRQLEQPVARLLELLPGVMPLVFCSCRLKPPDWPRPRIAGGISANTCASR